MAEQYVVTFVNNSANTGTVCLYQTFPGFGAIGAAYSLAWMTTKAAPSTTVGFQWSPVLGFAWDQIGVLAPGLIFTAAEYLPANLDSLNQVTLTQLNGGLQFVNQGPGPKPGSLFIQQDGTVQLNNAAVAFEMSGQPTLAVQAQPNMTVVLQPASLYWIIFGTFEQGEVLDTTLFGGNAEAEFTKPAQIVFPPGVFAMTATLNPDNTWTVQPS